ncbi:LIC_13387 family protein [Dokdonella sp.]|uniref:LIC_13387 family protein n=1 Tax=Dokdonella sp. TaxID=2291710 RepID=UPI002F40731D
MSELALRLGVRSAGSVLLIASGVHASAHYRAFVDTASFDAPRRALMDAMRAYVILPRWGVDAWTMLCGYSLCFAILLMLCGTLLWWMGRHLAATRLRPLAAASALVLCVGIALIASLDPMPVQMSVLALAALCLVLGVLRGRVATD